MTETKHTFCRICEALCGLEVTVDGDQIIDIKPDSKHVATQGYGCLKGLKQHRMYDTPDRLLYPMQRIGGELQRVSWDDAIGSIGSKVRELIDNHGRDSIAMYVGTAAGFGVLHPVFAQGFMQGVGSASMFSSATQDCANKFAVAHQVYGFPFTQPFPDLDNLECLIIVGANPAISKWSFLQVSNPIRRLKEIEARGAKIFIIDPRRTETAKVAGEHVFIRPNTDVFFYLSFLHELLATAKIDRTRIDEYMTGFDEVCRVAEAWPPERTAEVTRIPAETLRTMVRAYREAKGAALYCSTGVNMGTNGSLAFWLQECINAISGNLDSPGGTLVSTGVIDFAAFGKKTGTLLHQNDSRIGGFKSVNDAMPGGILADEILTPGDRQIKALFVTGGNPLITMANSERLRDAFKQLELLVVLDIQPSETASVATHVLPCTSPFQRPDLPFVFPLMLGLQSKPYLQATRAIVPPQGEQRDEATIYVDIAKASGINLWGSAVAQRTMEIGKALQSIRRRGEQPSIPQEFLLSSLLRVTKQGSFKKLLGEKHGRLRPQHDPGSFLGKRVIHEDKKVHLAPPVLIEQADKLEADFQLELDTRDKLKLITKRAITTHNSWTHNIEEFVAGDRTTNYLYVHPDDAARIGVVEGELADVSTDTATVRVPVKIHAELMPGTVALPHGWGHQDSALGVARKTTGVNVNLLAADGPDRLEKVSGMAHLTGFLVDVQPATGPLNPDHWSGIGA
ncbi:MAG: molybdopterin-dependent oxidoreductase [Myxococcales bacterium]|nr:molybdopterin-dependent oxidoreductase [Myxococcales bacterium]MDH3484431.1 molybdopterin-dependent oxidoreductase [Myxococcales bacterium]